MKILTRKKTKTPDGGLSEKKYKYFDVPVHVLDKTVVTMSIEDLQGIIKNDSRRGARMIAKDEIKARK